MSDSCVLFPSFVLQNFYLPLMLFSSLSPSFLPFSFHRSPISSPFLPACSPAAFSISSCVFFSLLMSGTDLWPGRRSPLSAGDPRQIRHRHFFWRVLKAEWIYCDLEKLKLPLFWFGVVAESQQLACYLLQPLWGAGGGIKWGQIFFIAAVGYQLFISGLILTSWIHRCPRGPRKGGEAICSLQAHSLQETFLGSRVSFGRIH